MMAKEKLTAYEQRDREVMARHKDSIFQRMSEPEIIPLETITSGSLLFDIAMGGGPPRRGFSMTWGPPSMGKSTLCLSAAAQISRWGKVHYLDTEGKIEQWYFKRIIKANGGNLDNITLVTPRTGNDTLELVEAYTGWDDAVYVDSIAVIMPTRQQNPDNLDKVFMGSQSRFIGDAINRIRYPLMHGGLGRADLPTGTMIMWVNQVRANFKAPPNSDGLRPFGGFAQAHGFKQVVKLGGGVVDKKRRGAEIKAWVTKSTINAPRARAVSKILFDVGIDLGYDTLMAGVKMGIIEARGAFYHLNGELLGHGKPHAGRALMEMGFDDLYALRDVIREAILANPIVEALDDDTDDADEVE
jgi:recombination protein RecA